RIELVEVRVSWVVDLVRDEHPRLARVAQQLRDVVIAWMQAYSRVDDEQQQIRFADRFIDLATNLDVHRHARIIGNAAGIDEPERTPGPVGLGKMAVARGARFFGDDRAVVADDPVEQRRLADVGPADERDDGNRAHAATGSPSCTSTSTKSYEG